MQLTWNISADDVARVEAFVATQANDALVRYRIRRNIENRPTKIDHADFWYAVVACLLTTQQRSGPKSQVTKFLNTDPFPLSLDRCRSCHDMTELVLHALKNYGGIRFAPKIAKQATSNLEWLEDKW